MPRKIPTAYAHTHDLLTHHVTLTHQVTLDGMRTMAGGSGAQAGGICTPA
jgi:hypothetical protein